MDSNRLTQTQENQLNHMFQEILEDANVLLEALRDYRPEEEKEMLAEELKSRGFINADPDKIDSGLMEIRMYSGISTEAWIEEYTEEYDDEVAINADAVKAFIMDNLHNLEYQFKIDITPEEYADRYPTDDPSALENAVESTPLPKARIKDIIYKDFRQDFGDGLVQKLLDEGEDPDDIREKRDEYQYDITDFYTDSPDVIAEYVKADAEKYGSAEKYVNSDEYLKKLLETHMLTYEIVVDTDTASEASEDVGISEAQFDRLEKLFYDTFEDDSELVESLKEKNPEFFEEITRHQLDEEGFPPEANIHNTDVMLNVFTKIEASEWAKRYADAYGLEQAERSAVDAYIQKGRAIEYIIDNMELADIGLVIAEEVGEWLAYYNEEYNEGDIEKERLRNALEDINRRKLRILIRREKKADIRKELEDGLRLVEVDPSDVDIDRLQYLLIDNGFTVSIDELVEICHKELVIEDKYLDYYIREEIYHTLLDYVDYEVKIALMESNIKTPKAILEELEEILPEIKDDMAGYFIEDGFFDIKDMLLEEMSDVGVILEDKSVVSDLRKDSDYEIAIIYQNTEIIAVYVYEKLQGEEQTIESYINSSDLLEDIADEELAEPEVELLLDRAELEEMFREVLY